MPALRNHLADNYGVLFACVLVTFVVGSLLPYDDNWAIAVVTLLCTVTAIDALVAARSPRTVLTPAAALAAIALLFVVVGLVTDMQLFFGIGLAAQAALFVVAMEQVLHAVFFAQDVSFRTILGALSVYGILGLLFSLLYVAVARNQDTPFFGNATPFGDGAFLYFSFATLTSTGYGDLAPAGQPGRMLAGLEMMTGQIFLVTLVAGLVALWRPGEALRRRRGHDA